MADFLFLFGGSLALRWGLILGFPVFYGGDATARLWAAPEGVLGYNLPFLQRLLQAAWSVCQEPSFLRLAAAVPGSLVAPAAALYVGSRTGSRRAGWGAGLLLAVHPMFLRFSLVPYQESPLVAFLFLAAWAAGERRWAWAAGAGGLAMATRYEGWLAAPLLGLAWLREPGHRTAGRVALGALAFGAVPLAWWISNGGAVTPLGTYVHPIPDWETLRIQIPLRLGFLLRSPFQMELLPLWPLGLLGLAAAVGRARELGWGWGYLALFTPLITIVAIPDVPNTLEVTPRTAHVPAAAFAVAVGLGLDLAWRHRRASARWLALGLYAGGLGSGLWQAVEWLRQETASNREGLICEAGGRLPERPEGEILVLGRAIPPEAVRVWLEEVLRVQGPAGLEAAKRRWGGRIPGKDYQLLGICRPDLREGLRDGQPLVLGAGLQMRVETPEPGPWPSMVVAFSEAELAGWADLLEKEFRLAGQISRPAGAWAKIYVRREERRPP